MRRLAYSVISALAWACAQSTPGHPASGVAGADAGLGSGGDEAGASLGVVPLEAGAVDDDVDASLPSMRDAMSHPGDAGAGRSDASWPLDGASRDGSREAAGSPWWADASLPDVTFVDVAVLSGVDHVHAANWSCSLGTADCDWESPRMTGGVAAHDYDGDGRVDLYFTRFNAPDRLYRNLGDGAFADVTVAAGLSASTRSNGAGFCDVDNDGDADLYVTTLGADRYYLYVNNGDGTFTEDAAARGAAVEPAVLRQGMSVSFGDFDKDGYPDLHTGEWRPAYLELGAPSAARLLRNRGAGEPGHFDDVTATAGVAMDGLSEDGDFAFASSFSDLDDDGWVDLAVAADFGTSRLFWNNGDGTFSDGTVAAGVGTDENGMGSAIGDYDGDGRLDWFVTSIFDPNRTCETSQCTWGFSGNRLYHNEGERVFSDQTTAMGVRDGAWGWGATFFDYDNDGDLDLVMTNGVDFTGSANDEAFIATPMRLWWNDEGVFREVAIPSGLVHEEEGKGLAVLDFDDDGDLDIVVANQRRPPRLYRNDGGNQNDWLRIRLRGTVSTRDALGARVWVTRSPGSAPILREVRYGSNFLGQNEAALHFGLGPSGAPVSEVRVRWPSGIEVTLGDVAPRQTLEIVEPAGG